MTRIQSKTERRGQSPELSFNELKQKKKEIALCEGVSYAMKQLKISGSELGRALRIPSSTMNEWLNKGRVPLPAHGLSNDAESIIHFLAIHRSLEAMLETPEAQQEWLKTYRDDLGSIPIDKIQESLQGLLLVRQYLDYYRGRGA